MLSALDAATRHHHLDADRPWQELLHDQLSLREYAQHLVSIYGFEAPVEAALALTPGLHYAVSLRARARAGWIVQDLHALGMRPAKLARLPQCSNIEPFRDSVEALGWLYVLERASLHYSALLAHLSRHLAEAPIAYLSTRPRDVFVRELDDAMVAESGDETAHGRIVSAAAVAFDVQRDWFECDVRVSSPELAVAR